ncbi:MAG: ExbD/TolR family protein [Ectothiorhodospira sp.]
MRSSPLLPPYRRRTPNADNGVLPLINIIFLLLIFFMIAGTVMQQPPFDVIPPISAHAPAQDPHPRYLAIAHDGTLAWQGRVITEEELDAALKEREDPEEPLQVRADMDLEARALTRLLEDLRGAGVAQIRILTREDD